MDMLSIGALTAAKHVAEQHGIPVRDAEVVSDGSNLLVHLKPSGVLARVATTIGLVRRPAGAWLERDLAVARYLHGQGAPVVPPSEELPAGPHHEDGYTMTFWQYVDADREAAPSVEEAAPRLRELHQALRGYRASSPQGELPYMGVVLDEIPRWLKFLESRRALSGGDLIALREAQWRLGETLQERRGETQALHGDAHRSNLLRVPNGFLWTDFEDACMGPAAWDVACLFRTAPAGGMEAALRGYPEALGWEELGFYRKARNLEGVVYRMVQAVRFPERKARALEGLEAWRKAAAVRAA